MCVSFCTNLNKYYSLKSFANKVIEMYLLKDKLTAACNLYKYNMSCECNDCNERLNVKVYAAFDQYMFLLIAYGNFSCFEISTS